MKRILSIFMVLAMFFALATTPTEVAAATNTEVTESETAPIDGVTVGFNEIMFNSDYPTVELFDIIYIGDYVTVDGGAITDGEVTFESIGQDISENPSAGIIDVYADGMAEVIRAGDVTIKVSRITTEGTQDEHDYILISFKVDGEAISGISTDHQRVELVPGETAVVTVSAQPSILSDDSLYESISYLAEVDYDVFECERIYYDKVTGEAVNFSAEDLAAVKGSFNYVWKGELLITGIEVGEGNLFIHDHTNSFETMVRIQVVEEVVEEEEPPVVEEEKPADPTPTPKTEEKAKPSTSPITGLIDNTTFFVLVALAALSGVALVKLNKKKHN